MLITRTPLRISLAGGATDFPKFYAQDPGCVVSFALQQAIYVILRHRFDEKICVSWSEKELVDTVDELHHELVREALKRTGVTSDIEVVTLSDIPSAGSGLGSSSSLTVGLLNALYHWQGRQVPAEQLARDACAIELDVLGKPIGKQDQYIAAYGGLRCFRFRSNGLVDNESIPLPTSFRSELENQLLLFYTGKTRLATAILEEQRDRIEETRPQLVAMRNIAESLAASFQRGSIYRLHRALYESWELKRQLSSGISDPGIDELVGRALNAGALGAKIAGAGGGGHLLINVLPEHQPEVRSALKGLRELPLRIDPYGTRLYFDGR